MDAINPILSYKPNPEEDYYAILGCDELSNVDQILSEYRNKARLFHPDKAPDCPDSVERFQVLQSAKEVLCSVELRRQYDKWRRSGICMSFKEWTAKADCCNASMHWAPTKKKEPMLEDTRIHVKSGSEDQWPERVSTPTCGREELVRKFRNYDI